MATCVLVLGGGPDAERRVSLISSEAVAKSLGALPEYSVNYQVIDAPSGDDLAAFRGDVIFPVLHGPWGEGGALQSLLEADGRPFVGCRSGAARVAMDKMASKLAAAALGIPTQPAAVFSARDGGCPLPFPVVVKPVHEGSSVGVHFARDESDWRAVRDKVLREGEEFPERVSMVESAVLGGRELTVGVLDGTPLDPVEICPQEAFYDYHAKYDSEATKYIVDPPLPGGVKHAIQDAAGRLFASIGCRHLSRVDFLLDQSGRPWLLEINTMPGFTGHSLLPMAAAHRGLPFAALCARLVQWAERDGRLK